MVRENKTGEDVMKTFATIKENDETTGAVIKLGYESFVDDIHAQIRLLCDVAPSFFKQTKLMGRDYLQLTENCIEKIQHIINEEITRV